MYKRSKGMSPDALSSCEGRPRQTNGGREEEMASSALQELLPFEISSSDITGLEEEDSRGSGSYGAVYAVTVKGTSRIAKRLHSILVGADVSRS